MKTLSEKEYSKIALLSKGAPAPLDDEEDDDYVHPSVEHNRILEEILKQLSASVELHDKAQKESIAKIGEILKQHQDIQKKLAEQIALNMKQEKAIEKPVPVKEWTFDVIRDDKGELKTIKARRG